MIEISPETAAAGLLVGRDLFMALYQNPCHMAGVGAVTFCDTTSMAREAIRKAQWRKLVSELPAGVQVPPPEGAS